MPTATFTNTSRRGFTPSQSWKNGTCYQGFLNNGRCGGEIFFDFSSLDLSNIEITNIVMSVSVGATGGSYTKYLYLHIGGYNGSSAGNYSFSSFYNTTKSKTLNESSNSGGFNTIKNYILSGGSTFGIYNGGSSRGKQDGKSYDYDYLSLTSMSFTITYEFKRSVGSIGPSDTGSASTMYITSYNSSYSHRVTWRLDNNNHTESVSSGSTNPTASYTIPHSWLPNSTAGTATAILETLDSGGNSLGTVEYQFSLTVPASIVPSISNVSNAHVNDGQSQNLGVYIQGKSKSTITVGSMYPGSGAKITSYTIWTEPNYGSVSEGGLYSDSLSSKTLTTANLSGSGNVYYKVTVTDSRGRTATVNNLYFYVNPYSPPRLDYTPTVYRSDASGNRRDSDGKYAAVTASISYATVSGANNALVTHTITVNGVTSDISSNITVVVGNNALELDRSYSASIYLLDKVGGSSAYSFDIPSLAYLLHFAKGGRSIGIGCAANSTPDDTVHVGWPLHLANNTWNPVGDDVYIGDCNQAGCLGIKGKNGATGLWFFSQDGQAAAKMYFDGNNFVSTNPIHATAFDCSDHIDVNGAINFWNNGSNKLRLWTDSEGGNIMIVSPDGHEYQFDAYNGDHLRLFAFDDNGNYHNLTWWRDSGTLSVERVYVGDALSTRENLGAALGTYTSGEVYTGEKWIDGKMIYRYTLSGTTTGTNDINLGAALPRTPDNVISFTGALHDGTNWRPLPHTTYYNLNQMCGMILDGNNTFHLYTQLSGTKKYNIVIDYTA